MRDYSFLKARPSDSRRMQIVAPHPSKNEFERDRDRIIYCRNFRRLDKKTQVFVSGFNDNVRTRLTHSIEVAQIAKRVARQFGFDEDLTEAIALGHDTGHTPFGHVGERTLNFFMNGCISNSYYDEVFDNDDCKGFKHNLQAFKSLNELETHRKDEKGLNLTKYTLWGIINHSNAAYKGPCQYYNCGNCLKNGTPCKSDGQFSLDYYKKYTSLLTNKDWTFEGIIVAMSDEIAQLHHDFEDGVCGGMITASELLTNVKKHFHSSLLNSIDKNDDELTILSTFSSVIIDELICKYINDLAERIDVVINEFGITDEKSFLEKKGEIYDLICENHKSICDYFNELLENKSLKILKMWISQMIINSEITQTMNGKAEYIITKLFEAYLRNPQQLPDKTVFTINKKCMEANIIELQPLKYPKFKQNNGVARENLNVIINANNIVFKTIIMRVICDYIAGMTDDYAISQFNKLYGSNNLQYI